MMPDWFHEVNHSLVRGSVPDVWAGWARGSGIVGTAHAVNVRLW